MAIGTEMMLGKPQVFEASVVTEIRLLAKLVKHPGVVDAIGLRQRGHVSNLHIQVLRRGSGLESEP